LNSRTISFARRLLTTGSGQIYLLPLMAYHLSLFGAPRLTREGEVVVSRAVQRRRLAILVILARAPRRTLTRERILGYLWPETAPDAGRRLLSEAIYVLRRELGEELLRATGDSITLSADVTCDVDAFAETFARGEWTSAVSLHTSPLLDGWYVPETPDFDRWIDAERAQLTNAYCSALNELAGALERGGDAIGAASNWQALIRMDPYNSTAVLRAALAKVASGERAGALTLILEHETLLRDDLGAALDSELTELAQDIRSGRLQPERRQARVQQTQQVLDVMSTRASTTDRSHDEEIGAARLTLDGGHQTPATTATTEARPALSSSSLTATLPVRVAPKRAGRRLLGLTAVTAVLSGMGLFAVQRTPRVASQASAGGGLDPLRIAVLYFDAPPNDSGTSYLTEGLAEGLIRELSDVRSIRVLSRDAVARYKNAAISADSIGRLLRAGTLVSATVAHSGDRVRVIARLVDVTTLRQFATITVEQARTELFALTDSLSLRTSDALRKQLGIDMRRRSLTDRPEGAVRNDRALDLLFQAEHLRKTAAAAWTTSTPGLGALVLARRNLLAADSLLALAQSLDSTFPALALERGWVAIAAGRLESGSARVVALSPAIGHAERARADLRSRTSPDSLGHAAVQHLLGSARLQTAVAIQTFRSEGALLRSAAANLDSAVALDARLAAAWSTLSEARRLAGDFEGAQRAAEGALAADAFLESADAVLFSGWLSAVELGDAPAAQRWCSRGQQRFPDDWRFIECELTNLRLDAAGLSAVRPDPQKAWALVARLNRVDPDEKARAAGRPYSPSYRRLTAAAVSAAAGMADTARAVLRAELVRVSADPELRTDILYDAAFVHLMLKEPNAARQNLRTYVKARPDLKSYIDSDKTLGSVTPID